MPKNKILIIGSLANSLIHFRGDLIKSLTNAGYQVYAAAPQMDKATIESLKKLNAVPLQFELQRTGLNPFKDLKAILQLKKIIHKHEIDLVFPYTIKPVIYGSIAARLNHTAAISLITGLGFTFSASSSKARSLQRITEFLYKIALRKNKVVIFQNSDDLKLFKDRSLINHNQKTALVNGSGVHLDKYPYRVNKKPPDRMIFVMVARLIREKGIDLYVDAAKKLKSKYPYAEFHVVGSPNSSPSAISEEHLMELNHKGIIVYHGFQENVPMLLSKSDVFVLPSYYREGIPRSILEALSIGMPIITTNTPGCKETIVPNKNGILIEPNNLHYLILAMEHFLKKPKIIEEMGIASRKLAEDKFDVDIINKNILLILQKQI